MNTPSSQRVETKYGVAFTNPEGQWRFQFNGGRGGTPEECALTEAGRNLTSQLQQKFYDEINTALQEAGVDAVVAGGNINPRHYLG